MGQNFAKISHKTNKSLLSIPLTRKWWKEANLSLEQLINLKPLFQKPAEWLRMGVERIYNSREFQAKKSLGTLCRATLVKLQFFLTLLLQKCLFKWWWGGRGKERALSFPSHPEQQTVAWKAQEKEPIETLCCWSVGGSYVQMEWSKLRLSTYQVHDHLLPQLRLLSKLPLFRTVSSGSDY